MYWPSSSKVSTIYCSALYAFIIERILKSLNYNHLKFDMMCSSGYIDSLQHVV